MRNRLSSTAMAILAAAFPMAALADVSNTETLSSGQHFSFDTGTAGTSGGDIAFTGTSITFQGSAGGFSFGVVGATLYGSFTGSTLGFLTYASTPISGSGTLAANEVFAVKTNGGNYAKVLITSVSSSSLAITYTAYGVSGSSNVPTISAVLDAGSYTANIAQGSIFVVKGSGLSAPGPVVETSFPLPPSVNGVSIAFTPPTGGTGIQAYMIYLYNQGGVNQLAAVLPSTVATGNYNVTVTNNGSTSAQFPVTVVKQKPALITADSTGYGLVVTQNYVSATELDVNRFTTGSVGAYTISPAHPGQTEIAYLVGSGADTKDPDNQASPGYNFLANGVTAQVIVGGTTITPSYLGRVGGGSGYEQVNFTLPANITTGCVVSFQVVENGIASATTFISIAPSASAQACVQPGYTTSQLQAFDNGATTNVGVFEISQFSTNAAGQSISEASSGGEFTQYSGFELGAIPPNVSSGGSLPTGCTVIQINGVTPTGTTVIPGTGVYLDAGKLTLTGPAASNLNNAAYTETNDLYSLLINGFGVAGNGNVVAGTYTLNGAGGTGVGPFKATLNLGTPLTVTGGLPAVVNRSAGLTINWTGGGGTDFVAVIGYSATVANSVTTGAEFICYTTAGAGSINIGSSILNQLPAISAAAITAGTGTGLLEISTASNVTSFTAPLVAGGSINSIFEAVTGSAASASFQ
jgi:uncharacterized protein (TIGR03437 family)